MTNLMTQPDPNSAAGQEWGKIPGLAQAPPDSTPAQAEYDAMAEFNNAALQQYIQTNYGYAAWILNNPELKAVLVAAAVNGWQQARISGALYQTDWWKQNGAQAGQFIALQNTDPTSAAQQVAAQKATVLATATGWGVHLDDATLTSLATQAAMFQWNGDQISQNVRALYSANTATPTGSAADMQQIVQQQAGNYLVNASPDMVNYLITAAVRAGNAPAQLQSSLQDYFGNQAKLRFPWMASAIERGMTPKDYLDPYTQQAAKTLSISPDSIDWSSPKWQGALLNTDFSGAQVPNNVDVFNKKLMQDPTFQYSKTQGAIDQAYSTAQTIEQTFGAIAR